MTPYIFTDALKAKNVTDQWTFMEKTNSTYSHKVLKDHWSTWIVESDFEQIAAAGLSEYQDKDL